MSGHRVHVTCPYCGFQNYVTVAGNLYSEINIVSCDVDEGGCDGAFAARSTLRIETEGLEIKGCEPPHRGLDDGPEIEPGEGEP
jgi:hypothetical protein